jgi:hypothetical protein
MSIITSLLTRAGPINPQVAKGEDSIKQNLKAICRYQTVTKGESSMKTERIRQYLLAALTIICAATLTAPRAAEANTAAGTVLTNSVSVSYNDAVGTPQTAATGSVSITVNLVGGVAWLTPPSAQDTGSGQALSSAYTIVLHNTGNGSDTFAITDLTTNGAGLGAGAFTITPVSQKLLGTVTAAAGTFAAGNTTIPVSNLDTATIVVGTTKVQIGANVYTVAAGSTATQLVVTGDATAVATGAGIQIGEQYTVSYNGTVGTLTAGTANADHTHALRAVGASQGGNTAATADSSTWLTHVHGPSLSVVKYVRNLLNNNGNTSGTGSISLYGNTYYTGSVTGNPGDTLEYVVIVKNSNPAVSGSATAVIFEDTFPLYTAYMAGQTKVDKATGSLVAPVDTEACNEASGIFATDTCGGANPTKLKVFLGTGGVEGATYPLGTGGTIPGGNNAAATWGVLYHVTIN